MNEVPSFSGSQWEYISPEHGLAALTQRMDLTTNGNARYMLVVARAVFFNGKNWLWNI